MSAQITIDNQTLQEQMRSFLKEHLSNYIAEYVNINELRLKELSVIERVVRVEEELKHLRILEAERHESLMKEMNARFDLMNTRFESLQKDMNIRFEALQQEMNARFDLMNTRFESLQKDTNTRFESLQKDMNTRFEALEKRFSFMQWLIASGIAIIALLAALRPAIP